MLLYRIGITYTQKTSVEDPNLLDFIGWFNLLFAYPQLSILSLISLFRGEDLSTPAGSGGGGGEIPISTPGVAALPHPSILVRSTVATDLGLSWVSAGGRLAPS